MEKVSNRIIEQLIQRGMLQSSCSEQMEAYSYIIEKHIFQLITILALLLISIVTRTYIEMIFLSFSCFLIRRVAGGFHMPSHLTCFLLTIFLFGGVALCINQIPYSLYHIISGSLALCSFFTIFHYAPSLHENDWHSEQAQKTMRKKSRLYSGIFSTFVFLVSIVQGLSIQQLWAPLPFYLLKSSIAIAFGLALASNSVFINSIQNKVEKRIS